MTTEKIIVTILVMLSGLAVFMFGLLTMSERLEKQAGNRLRKIFNKATNNRFLGVATGAGVTAIIQSSSATTVMVVGFVNAGIMTLSQAAAVIFGANIGTTVTAVIISLPISEVLAASALIGVFMVMFTRKSTIRNVGYIMVGLGMIFAGLIVMSTMMKQFAALPSFKNFFASTSNPILLLLIGMLVTAIIQSSSATSGILITLANVGLIGMENSVFIILGINIGTCITALLASIGATSNAKRAAAIHLMFNITGALFFFILLLFTPIRNGIINLVSSIGGLISGEELGAKIAAFHILFNVSTTLLLLPFITLMVSISKHVIPDSKGKGKEKELMYLNDMILETPPIAVAQAKREIIRMAEMARCNLELAVSAAIDTSLKNKEDFDKREEYIDWLNQEIPNFLTKISALQISYEDEFIIASYYHVISDIERIGDYAENLFDYTARMDADSLTFSDDAKKEIQEMYNEVVNLYNTTMKGFIDTDISLLGEVERLEDNIDEFKLNLSNTHIKRLNEGICTASTGALFLSLVSNLERIADHMRNIFNSIRKYTRPQKITNVVVSKKQ